MPRALDPVVSETLKKYGFGKEAVWDCHGTWVVYHNVVEQMGLKAGVELESPTVIEANSKDGVAAILVVGSLGNLRVWSIGEASPKNNKNSYCYAMAEKRAVDRVILKLIGLHGKVYSEEEADTFKDAAPMPKGAEAVVNAMREGVKNNQPPKDQRIGPLGITELKTRLRTCFSKVAKCEHQGDVAELEFDYTDELNQAMHDAPDVYEAVRNKMQEQLTLIANLELASGR